MKKFLEHFFPIISKGKTWTYIICGLCAIFLLVYQKGKEEMAILITLSALLPLATMQGVRDDYMRFAQRKDPENGRKTLPQFLIWAILHTQQGFNSLFLFVIFIFLFVFSIIEKFSLIH